MPASLTILLGSAALSAALGWSCAAWRGWSPRQRPLALLLGMHLGPLGWLAVLLAPRRR